MPVPHVLHLCTLLGFHQQQVLVPVFRFLQGTTYHDWIPLVFGCSGTNGCRGPAFDEHP